MTQLDEDLARLVHEDPLHTGVADTAALIRAGSRLRRRRQLAISAGAGLAAAAVVAPFMLLGGSGDTVGLSPAASPSPGTDATATATATATVPVPVEGLKPDATPGPCGVAVCKPIKGTYGSPERGELIGAQLELGTFDGSTEVLYAARNKGFDTRTGEPLDSVDVISTGIVVDGRLRRTVWAFQPHQDELAGPLGLYGGERTMSEDGQAHFGLFGYVEGEHTSVTATSADGQTRAVRGISTEVYPGYTVFFDTGAWDDAWGDRAELTYAVPGGASCSVQQCGTIG
jgi:hypothetical protein